MPPCTECAAPLGAGRFCTSCGATPVDATAVEHTRVRAGGLATDTAERRAVMVPDDGFRTVAVPPPAVDLPPSQRFPMYADELDSDTSSLPVTAPAHRRPLVAPSHVAASPRAASPVGAAPGFASQLVARLGTRRLGSWPSWLPVAALALATLVVGAAAVALVTRPASSTGAAPRTVPDQSSGGLSSPGASSGSSAGAAGTGSGEVAGLARAFAPRTAPAALDLAGRPVDYKATNLLDGHPGTCWRTAGDATGLTLRFTLDQPTRLTKVGLINGYAKTAYSGGRTFDWYAGDRRVLRATWLFDDGSSVSQTFRSTRALQTMSIKPVTTGSVRLRLTAVSAPGAGHASRDYTALSEISLVGSAA